MIYPQNLHTHTTYCDGKDTPCALILRAIELGFDAIGFSGHSYMFYSPDHSMSLSGTEEYKKEINALKAEFKDEIEVYCGLEFDMYSVVDLSGYDYLIGAVHYLKKDGGFVGFDRSAEVVQKVINEHFQGDGMQYAKAYYEALATLPQYGKFDIAGHFDLIAKHAETHGFFDMEDKKYQSLALDALYAVFPHIPFFEVNTGAISRGYRTTPYPAPFLMKELKKLNGKLVLSSDCHDKTQLDCHFAQSLDYIKSFGFKEIYTMKKGKFTGVKL